MSNNDTHAPLPKAEVIDICRRALYGVEAEWTRRVYLYAENRYNRWWRRLLRRMGFKTATVSDLVEDGWWWLEEHRGFKKPSELWDGAHWLDVAEHVANDTLALAYRSTGDVTISKRDLYHLRKYAE